jgi:RNA polymerase sigma-70 factor (ECF subfamily)
VQYRHTKKTTLTAPGWSSEAGLWTTENSFARWWRNAAEFHGLLAPHQGQIIGKIGYFFIAPALLEACRHRTARRRMPILDVNFSLKASLVISRGTKPVVIRRGTKPVEKAFQILVEENRPMLLAYVSTLLYGDRHEAEDVVQESFLLAYQRLGGFRSGENFGGWLRAIARRKAMESHRASRKRRVIVDSRIIEGIEEVFAIFDSPPLGEESRAQRMNRWIQHCVGKIDKSLRIALLRVYQEGMSLRRAAAAEGVTSVAFAKRLSRARDAVRKCVKLQSENGL